MNYTAEDTAFLDNVQCTFHGDAILDPPPATFNDAVKAYKQIPDLAKKSKTIIKYDLTPITNYCTTKHAILQKMQTALLDNLSHILNDIENTQIRIDSLKTSRGASFYSTTIGHNMDRFDTEFTKFVSNWKQELAVLLPKFRGNSNGDHDLVEHIQHFELSPFDHSQAKIFLDIRQKEIETIQLAIREEVNEKIVISEEGTASDNACLFNHTGTLEYNLYVLPTEGIVDRYIKKKQESEWDEGDKWFYNSRLVSKAGKMYRDFVAFYELNKEHLKTCFLIKQRKIAENNSNPIRLSAYSHGDILTDDVSLPKKPPQPKKIFVSYDQIKFNVSGIQPNAITKWIFVEMSIVGHGHGDNIINVTSTNATEEENKKFDWKSNQTFEIDSSGVTTILMQQLEPDFPYDISIRAMTKIGNGPITNFQVQTPVTSAPTDFILKSKSMSHLVVQWKRPAKIAPSINITNITYEMRLYNSSGAEIRIPVTVNAELNSHTYSQRIDDLHPGKFYKVTVKAMGPKEDYLSNLYGAHGYVVLNEGSTSVIEGHTLPSPPTSISEDGDKTTKDSVAISWQPPSQPANDYNISFYTIKYFRIDPRTQKAIEPVLVMRQTARNASANLTSLAWGVTYSIQVKLHTTVGSSEYSNAITASTIPTNIDNLEDLKKCLDIEAIEHKLNQHKAEIDADGATLHGIAEKYSTFEKGIFNYLNLVAVASDV